MVRLFLALADDPTLIEPEKWCPTCKECPTPAPDATVEQRGRFR